MPATWIDFHALREQLDFADVLEHYGVSIKSRRGDQISCLCPLPDHPIRHEQGKRTASFSGNLRKNCWQCFGCGQHGGVLDFALLMENKDPGDREAVREVAMQLAETFNLTFDRPPPERRRKQRDHRRHRNGSTTNEKATDASTSVAQGGRAIGEIAQPTRLPDKHIPRKPIREVEKIDDDMHREALPPGNLPVVVNPPLNFELQHLDADHPYLASRGLNPETVAYFGLGFCSRGMLKGRVAIPLHDPNGILVGYGGRIVDDTLIDDQAPKYLFPAPRERDGRRIEFRKSALLYNAHRIDRGVDNLIVVEGFASVWHLHQLGHVNVVALMGSSCSPEQAGIIVNLVHDGGRVWLMPDADPAGEKCAETVLHQLSPHRFCRWIQLTQNQQPTDLDDCRLTMLTSVEAA